MLPVSLSDFESTLNGNVIRTDLDVVPDHTTPLFKGQVLFQPGTVIRARLDKGDGPTSASTPVGYATIAGMRIDFFREIVSISALSHLVACIPRLIHLSRHMSSAAGSGKPRTFS